MCLCGFWYVPGRVSVSISRLVVARCRVAALPIGPAHHGCGSVVREGGGRAAEARIPTTRVWHDTESAVLADQSRCAILYQTTAGVSVGYAIHYMVLLSTF